MLLVSHVSSLFFPPSAMRCFEDLPPDARTWRGASFVQKLASRAFNSRSPARPASDASGSKDPRGGKDEAASQSLVFLPKDPHERERPTCGGMASRGAPPRTHVFETAGAPQGPSGKPHSYPPQDRPPSCFGRSKVAGESYFRRLFRPRLPPPPRPQLVGWRRAPFRGEPAAHS